MTLEIDMQRVQRRLDKIWNINRTDDGGATRIAYSDEETDAIEYICGCVDDSYTIETDHIGNVYITKKPGSEATIFLGSHLDSVYNGGRLDGSLGVVVALEAIETAYEVGSPLVPPTLVILRAEESSRFGQWGIGSRGALGQLTVEELSATDGSNIPLWQAMQEQGLQPSNFSEPTFDAERIYGFLEVHIEQGRVLDNEDVHLGIVDDICAPVRYEVTVNGEYDHSGATPMEMRYDALAGSAAMVTEIERIASEASGEGDIVGTVGEFSPVDAAVNKVCGEVTFTVDLRSNDRSYRDTAEELILRGIEQVADNRRLELAMKKTDESDPVTLDGDMIDLLEESITSLNYDYRMISSGGGHDAMKFQQQNIPSGMLFVPSIDGVSHNPDEATPAGATQKSIEVVTEVLLSTEASLDQRS